MQSVYTAALKTDQLPATGCSLDQYCTVKQLPKDWLTREFALSEERAGCIGDQPLYRLRLPYRNPHGAELAVRYRLSLSGGQRFIWRTNDSPYLYGTERLDRIKQDGYCFLVEGESDVHTMRWHDLPALGLPGNQCWNEALFAPLFDDIKHILVVIEPGKSGEGMLRWISKSALRKRVQLIRLDPYKDPSELHTQDPSRFFDVLEAACARAAPWGILKHTDVCDELNREAAPLRFLIEDYLPEGFIILAGDPKVGKSWLVVDFAIAAITQGCSLGKPVLQTDVMYFGLEDNHRRMKDRVLLVAGDREIPRNRMFVEYVLPNLDDGLIDKLAMTLDHRPTVGLVIVDILARVRGKQGKNQGAYAFDVDTLAPFADLARQRRITLIAVHHTNKSKGNTVNDVISGTHATGGMGDTNVVMTHVTGPAGVKQARFRTDGKDAEAVDLLLQFDPDLCRWQVLGDYADEKPTKVDTAADILDVLRRHGPMRPAIIAEKIGKSEDAVKAALRRMERKAQVETCALRGHWTLPEIKTEP